MSQRSAGSCTHCIRANVFPANKTQTHWCLKNNHFFAYHNPVLGILMQVLNAMQLSATQCLWSQLLLLLCSAPHVICRKLCQEQEEFQPCLQNHTRTVSMPYLSDKDTLWNKIEILFYLVKAKNPVYVRSSLLNINP